MRAVLTVLWFDWNLANFLPQKPTLQVPIACNPTCPLTSTVGKTTFYKSNVQLLKTRHNGSKPRYVMLSHVRKTIVTNRHTLWFVFDLYIVCISQQQIYAYVTAPQRHLAVGDRTKSLHSNTVRVGFRAAWCTHAPAWVGVCGLAKRYI